MKKLFWFLDPQCPFRIFPQNLRFMPLSWLPFFIYYWTLFMFSSNNMFVCILISSCFEGKWILKSDINIFFFKDFLTLGNISMALGLRVERSFPCLMLLVTVCYAGKIPGWVTGHETFEINEFRKLKVKHITDCSKNSRNMAGSAHPQVDNDTPVTRCIILHSALWHYAIV